MNWALSIIPQIFFLALRIPEVCGDLGQRPALERCWNAELAKEWIARQNAAELYFYCDGHVRVDHGEKTALPRDYVARE